MGLKTVLSQRKNHLVQKWFNAVVDTYPADASKFLKNQKDPFGNPVGNITSKGLECLFDALLLNDMKRDVLLSALDPIIRIRTVQDFSPSQATCFILLLKKIIRDDLKQNQKIKAFANEISLLEDRIDELLLLSFDIYVKCREKIYELKANEVKNRTFRAFERAGLIREEPEASNNFEEHH
jgi:hypothetical protein